MTVKREDRDRAAPPPGKPLVAVMLFALVGFVPPTGRPAHAQPSSGDAEWQSYRAHIAAAQAWLDLNEPARAREWIDAAPPAHRGWEWRLLQRQLDVSLAVPFRDAAGFMDLSVAPDGKRAACLTGNGKLTIIALPDGAVLRTCDAHTQGGGFSVRFAPDGTRIASSGADRLVKIWDAETGELKLTFDQHKFPVGGLAWSPDSTRIASSAYYVDKETPIEGRVHIWNAADGAILHTMRTGQKPVVCTDWSRDGRFVAAGTWDSEVVVWSAADGSEVRTINERPGPTNASHVDAVALSPDGELVAYGSSEKWVRVHRVATGERVADLHSHGQPIAAVRFSPDGRQLATGGGDDTIRVWDTATWQETATLRGHAGRMRGLAYGPDGSRLYSASLDGTVRMWDPSSRDTAGLRFAHPSGNYAVSFSPDGTRVAGAGYDGIVPVWDSRTGALTTSWPAHMTDGGCSPVCMTDWSPDGGRVATCSWDKTAKVYDAATRAEVLKIEHAAGVADITWGPAGDVLATCGRDKQAHLWDAATGKLVRSFTGHEGQVNEVRFSADGGHVATVSDDKTARVWDVAGGACTQTLRGHRGAVQSACWSPDGARIATGGADGSVRLWNTTTGEQVRVLHQGDEPIYRVAFSPDGSRIACAGRELVLLDPAHVGAAARLRPHADMGWNIDWSPDGHRLASGSWDGSVVILDAAAITRTNRP